MRHALWLFVALAACATHSPSVDVAIEVSSADRAESPDVPRDVRSDVPSTDSADVEPPDAADGSDAPDVPDDVAPDVRCLNNWVCEGRCVDLFTDPMNCNACGRRCAPPMACMRGSCL